MTMRTFVTPLWWNLPTFADVQGDGETKRREDRRRKAQTPTSTLFIVNFDVDNTREGDLEKHFTPYGKLKRVQIKRNYGFIQYDSLEDAIAAREATNLSRLLGQSLCLGLLLQIHSDIAECCNLLPLHCYRQ